MKYIIRVGFSLQGRLKDQDTIISAVHTWIELLLDRDLPFDELQKSSQVGRILVNINNTDSMITEGTIYIASSMDISFTALLAAGIEDIDKVGLLRAKFTLIDIINADSRRESITIRANAILDNIKNDRSSNQTLRHGIMNMLFATNSNVIITTVARRISGLSNIPFYAALLLIAAIPILVSQKAINVTEPIATFSFSLMLLGTIWKIIKYHMKEKEYL